MTNSLSTTLTPLARLCAFALIAAMASSCGSSNDGGISGTGDPSIITSTDNSAAGDTGGNDASSGGGASSPVDTGGDSSGGNTTPESNALSGGSAGLLNTATPQFDWQAVDGADSYQLVMTEAEGNTIIYNASTAVCSGSSCSATPTAAYHNNSVTWQIDALNDGSTLQTAASGSYTTPRSFELTPETSNAARCSIWPSISYDNVIVLNNIWNAGQVYTSDWSQTISATESDNSTPVASWNYDWLEESNGDRTAVKAYPEIIYGNKLGTHVSGSKAQTGLPETVSNLPEFSVDFAFTETLDNNVERNVALESFFHDSCDITGPCDTTDNRAYEMMVWVVNPESNRPGDLAVSGVMIDNRLWDVYIKPRSDKKYIAFTAQTPFDQGTLQWNRFVEWTMQWTAENSEALSINALTPNLCMAAIEMGTELWWGKGSFTLDKFTVSRSQ